MKKLFSTGEACAKLGVSRVSLHRWICEGRIQPPPIPAGRTRVYWTEADIEAVRLARKAFPPRGKRRLIVDVSRVRALRSAGQPWTKIGEQLGVSRETARRAL
jgi:predicted DNA-binding transcriptional regulator AlpA